MKFKGTAGDDNFTGNAGADTFAMTQGGIDTVKGGNGADHFQFGATLTSADKIDGGAGDDLVHLNGDYSGANRVDFGAQTMVNVETLAVAAGHSYEFGFNTATLPVDQTLTVDGRALGADDTLRVSDFQLAGRSNMVMYGGAGADFFGFNTLARVTVHAGDGHDQINMLEHFRAADHIDGGAGDDEVDFSGDYSAGLVLRAATIANVESLFFNAGHNYKITTDDANVASGQHLDVNGFLLQATDTFIINASHETDGTYTIFGGAGDDTVIGGQAGNILFGGLGHDRLTAGLGDDTFRISVASQSTGLTRDIVKGFDAQHDNFNFTFETVTGVDAARVKGKLNTAHFDDNMESAANANHLGAHHAMLFTASAGDLSGHIFLVVDANGTAGYQAGEDTVIELSSATHLSSLSTTNFV